MKLLFEGWREFLKEELNEQRREDPRDAELRRLGVLPSKGEDLPQAGRKKFIQQLKHALKKRLFTLKKQSGHDADSLMKHLMKHRQDLTGGSNLSTLEQTDVDGYIKGLIGAWGTKEQEKQPESAEWYTGPEGARKRQTGAEDGLCKLKPDHPDCAGRFSKPHLKVDPKSGTYSFMSPTIRFEENKNK